MTILNWLDEHFGFAERSSSARSWCHREQEGSRWGNLHSLRDRLPSNSRDLADVLPWRSHRQHEVTKQTSSLLSPQSIFAGAVVLAAGVMIFKRWSHATLAEDQFHRSSPKRMTTSLGRRLHPSDGRDGVDDDPYQGRYAPAALALIHEPRHQTSVAKQESEGLLELGVHEAVSRPTDRVQAQTAASSLTVGHIPPGRSQIDPPFPVDPNKADVTSNRESGSERSH